MLPTVFWLIIVLLVFGVVAVSMYFEERKWDKWEQEYTKRFTK